MRMQRWTRHLLEGSLWALILWSTSPGLTPRELAAQETTAEALATLPRGTEVRIRTAGGRTVTGLLLGASEDSVRIGDPTSAVGPGAAVALAEVRTVWRRSRSAPQGGRVGATVGSLGLGGFIGLIAWGLCDKAVCDGEFVHGLMVGAPIGAAAGAALGALVGAVVPRWRSLAEDPPPPAPPARASFHVGRASGLERAGFGTRLGADPVVWLRGGLGTEVRPGLDAVMELAYLDYAQGQRAFAPHDPSSAFVDEDARSWVGSVGVGTRFDRAGVVRGVATVGLARTHVTRAVTRPWPSHTVTTTEESGTGMVLGLGIGAGWALASGVRMGFGARADWISSSPLGDVPTLTFSMGLWS